MATAPVKPQQLHNFPISLKWGQTTTTTTISANHQHHHHNRSSSSNNQRLATPVHESETESDPDQSQSTIRHPRVGSRSARVHRYSFASCSTLLPKAKTEIPQKPEATEKPQQKNLAVLENNNKNEAEEIEEEDSSSRPWKLRPRKGILTGSSKETATLLGNEQRDSTTPKSMRLRGLVDSTSSGLGVGLGNGVSLEKKEKRKFWVALSREEIEEDVFVLTGSRPARRPKKRPKNVQKILDSVFPGLWLVGTTADSYRVADPPVKR
ncbi:uncharacterized protein LOC8286610 [Ricinus communis]|uniref:DUF1639 domain-containing protein n=1 Tax=Ricinus communis TaxID=3988 RepID=B9SZP3_RICCO|nr:uncharacterized protein LOC8286610 [Ricinus communis]EEF30912.1 conserved hypothetical protein [Ricinus communis]|eukprot:XP_002531462.1 uncharacterized protein LOC8286610 [Ricinus communis]